MEGGRERGGREGRVEGERDVGSRNGCRNSLAEFQIHSHTYKVCISAIIKERSPALVYVI